MELLCIGPISLSKWGWIMWTKTLKMVLKRTLQRLIGLKSLNEDDTSILGIDKEGFYKRRVKLTWRNYIGFIA